VYCSQLPNSLICLEDLYILKEMYSGFHNLRVFPLFHPFQLCQFSSNRCYFDRLVTNLCSKWTKQPFPFRGHHLLSAIPLKLCDHLGFLPKTPRKSQHLHNTHGQKTHYSLKTIFFLYRNPQSPYNSPQISQIRTL